MKIKLLFILFISVIFGCSIGNSIDMKPDNKKNTASKNIQDNNYIYRIVIENKIGFINSAGKIIIEPIYDYYNYSTDGIWSWYHDYYNTIYVTSFGFVMFTRFNYGDPFNQGLAKVKYKGKWGFIDTSGKLVIPAVYDDVHFFKEDRAAVLLGDKWGYIDKKGNMVIKPDYGDEAFYFNEERVCVKKNGKFGFVDKDGRSITPVEFDLSITNTRSVPGRTYYGFRDGMALIEKENKQGFINKDGSLVIPFDNVDYSYFEFGVANANKGNLDGLINKKGEYILKPSLGNIMGFAENKLAVFFYKKPGKEGYINTKGEIIIEPIYDETNYFFEDRAVVGMGEHNAMKYGYIDSTGKIVVPLIYDGAVDFRNGYGVVRFFDRDVNGRYKGSHYGIIDKNGNCIIQPIIKWPISGYYNGILICEVGVYKFDLVDTAGNRITGNEYEYIGPFIGGIAEVWLQQDGVTKVGYIDKTGKYVWEPTN